MTELIPWTRPRGAVHDLLHLLSLDADHCIVVCLSARELYVLQNWLPLDLEFKSRYAVTMQNAGYEPLTDDHDLVGAWLNFVRDFQVAVDDVSCNIERGLNAIADALALMAQNPGGSGGGCGTGPVGQVLGCLDGLPNEAFLPQPGLELTGNPPEGFETWEEYNIYKCAAANWIWAHERATMAYYRGHRCHNWNLYRDCTVDRRRVVVPGPDDPGLGCQARGNRMRAIQFGNLRSSSRGAGQRCHRQHTIDSVLGRTGPDLHRDQGAVIRALRSAHREPERQAPVRGGRGDSANSGSCGCRLRCVPGGGRLQHQQPAVPGHGNSGVRLQRSHSRA